jgi:hypothetical protein
VNRIVQPEILDALLPENLDAIGSRRDLNRLNRLMRHPAIMADAMAKNWQGPPPGRLTEIGAGDGKFLLSVAQKISTRWPNVRATLLDRQKSVTPETLADFAAPGWRAEAVVADVFDWPRSFEPGGVVIANLFLHHFQEARLAELLKVVSQRAELFIALEPCRARWPLFCSRLLWAIGCNYVTQHDAEVSVRAGFDDSELCALWPDKQNWELAEYRTGMFSHIFIARKTS